MSGQSQSKGKQNKKKDAGEFKLLSSQYSQSHDLKRAVAVQSFNPPKIMNFYFVVQNICKGRNPESKVKIFLFRVGATSTFQTLTQEGSRPNPGTSNYPGKSGNLVGRHSPNQSGLAPAHLTWQAGSALNELTGWKALFVLALSGHCNFSILPKLLGICESLNQIEKGPPAPSCDKSNWSNYVSQGLQT